MARILVNFIYNRSKDEFVLMDPGHVLADQPYAVMETEEEVRRPLVVPIKGMLTVVDRENYEAIHRIFSLSADEKGNVKEDPNGTKIWLPKDTDVSKLRYINNQLVMIDDSAEPEPKKEAAKEQKVEKKSSHKKEA